MLTNYTYFGTRHYDSDGSFWLSVDPMADARSWVSPYSYCQNSPVMRVDPTGALDDEWELNKKTGEITWVKESNKHQLFALDENGKRTGESITVNNRDVLDQFSTKGDLDRKDADGNSISKGHSTGSIDDVFNVFLFGANNSNVEWATARYNDDQYAVWSGNVEADSKSNIHQHVASPNSVGLSNINAHLHSHPNINLTGERFSMGEGYTGYNPYSDWGHKIEGTRPYPMYVYFPNSRNLYHISEYKISLNSRISNYKDLYFGVFNHR